MMGTYQKVNAQVHIIMGPQHISLQFEANEAAESQWNSLVGILKIKKPGDWSIVNHANGGIWLDLDSVTGVTWTKEQRVNSTMMPGVLTGARQ